MTDLNIYITSFNCGRAPIDVDYFAASLFRGLKTSLPPDLVILALQEIAPISASFLGGSLLKPYSSRLKSAVHKAKSRHYGSGDEYGVVTAKNLGMTAIIVFARPELEERIGWIQTAGVGVGVWEMGNKGAVGVRLGLDAVPDDEESILTFVAAHLAPGEDAWKSRNQDWRSICEGLVFGDGQEGSIGKRIRKASSDTIETEPLLSDSSNSARVKTTEENSMFSPASYVFFAGDLNYRTSDVSPQINDFRSWPQTTNSFPYMQQFSDLFASDQLNRERNSKSTLHYLAEHSIDFPPTYKYSKAAQKQAASLAQPTENEGVEWLWAKHRVPSWCDRILYSSSARPIVHQYTALPVQPTSDHRPVAMSCSLPTKPIHDLEKVTPPFAIRSNWREARVSARRYEVAVGLAAYLVFTWEGEALVAGTVIGIIGGYLILRAMLGT